MFESLKSLFGPQTEEEKKTRLEKLIATDPKLKEIDDRITQLNNQAAERMEDATPEDDAAEILGSLGIHIKR